MEGMLNSLPLDFEGDPRVCIAVLDGPVDLSHPCFDGANLTVLETLAGSRADDHAAARHGTHVASVLFGQPGTVVRGLTPRCRGLIVPVFQGAENGEVRPCSQLDLARGIVQAVTHGANIINISGGQLDPSGQAEQPLAEAVRQCAESGVLVVAAAGNDGCACLHIPAAIPSVLVVGAMDERGEPLEYSNWGEPYRARGVLATAENVVGAVPGGGVASASGTSFAVPLVSGLAALLLSTQLKRGVPLDVSEVRRAILETAIGCDEQSTADCSRLLAGRLNAAGALNYLDQRRTTPMSLEALATPANVPAAPTQQASQVAPAACGCGCSAKSAPQMIYALGQLDYDFGTEANRDAFKQLGVSVPESREEMARYLTSFDEAAFAAPAPQPEQGSLSDEEFRSQRAAWARSVKQRLRAVNNLFTNQAYAEQLIWVLKQEEMPLYAIMPGGPFAMQSYARLLEFFEEQVAGDSERVSLPGYIVGKTRLLNGLEIPVVAPDSRGLCNWTVRKLIESAYPDSDAADYDEIKKEVENFLQRVYHEVRNLGVLPQERALNFAATNIFQFKLAQAKALYDSLFDVETKLDTVEVERSPQSRPGSDCWDIKLTFFQPAKRLETARQVHRFTVDVSQVIPVTVGSIRSWFVN